MMNLLQQAMKIKTDGLFLCVLGPSGAGKSHFIGTYPGRTALLYGAGESHGPSSATKLSKDLLALAWDQEVMADGVKSLTPDQSWVRLKSILDPAVLIGSQVKCVAVDSITNLCLLIKQTAAFRQRCSTGRGGHNAFKETEALIEMLSEVVNKLQILVDQHSIDVIVTMDLQIQSVAPDGTITESKPGLPSFGVGRALIQQFPDILVLGRIGTDRTPMFQNKSTVASVSKDGTTHEIVKYIEYTPRLRGVLVLPELIAASVPAILKLKPEVKS